MYGFTQITKDLSLEGAKTPFPFTAKKKSSNSIYLRQYRKSKNISHILMVVLSYEIIISNLFW